MAQAELALAPTISAVRPSTAQAQAGVQLEFDGTGFLSGATIELTNADSSKITGTSVGVFNYGVLMKGTFDLTKASPSVGVLITNPRNKSATLSGALTVTGATGSGTGGGSTGSAGTGTGSTGGSGATGSGSTGSAGTGGGSQVGPINLENPLGPTATLPGVLKKIFNEITLILSFIIPIIIIVGAFQMMFAAGNPEKFATGQKTIVYAIIGYVVILMANGIISIVKSILTP